jgi:hypothetical protein
MIPVVEKEYIIKHTVNAFEIDICNLELFKSVTVCAKVNDIEGRFVTMNYFTIEGEEYNAWGNSDEYLIQLIAQKMGFTLKPE